MESAITEPMPAEPTKVSVLDRVLGAATIEEIEAEQARMRAAIYTAKTQFQLLSISMKNSIEALDVIRRALILQRDGKPPAKQKAEGEAKPTRRRRGTGGGETIADQIESLLRQHGPMTIKRLEQLTGKSYGTLYSAMNCDRFDFNATSVPRVYGVAGEFG